MPVYDLWCPDCKYREEFLARSILSSFPSCPHCGKTLKPRVWQFAFHKSMKTIHEESGEPEEAYKNPDYYKDPRNIGRWVEKKMSQMGIEMPESIKEMIRAAREGEMPEPLKDL